MTNLKDVNRRGVLWSGGPFRVPAQREERGPPALGEQGARGEERKSGGSVPFTTSNRRLTSASPQTLKLLASVKSLRLTELDNSRDGSLEAWFTEQYNPMQMARGMASVLNGPGGQIEQTLLYLDPAERGGLVRAQQQ